MRAPDIGLAVERLLGLAPEDRPTPDLTRPIGDGPILEPSRMSPSADPRDRRPPARRFFRPTSIRLRT